MVRIRLYPIIDKARPSFTSNTCLDNRNSETISTNPTLEIIFPMNHDNTNNKKKRTGKRLKIGDTDVWCSTRLN